MVSIWEHEFDHRAQHHAGLQQFLQTVDIQDPLNPRDALYGGRTNATRLYCEEGDMRYVDVCSLYPYVLKYKAFPVGHPEVITSNFGNVRDYLDSFDVKSFRPGACIIPCSLTRQEENYCFPYAGPVPSSAT